MRITSIRSLPDVDTDDALQDTDEEVKEHLLRDHIVRSSFHVVVTLWRLIEIQELGSFVRVSGTSKW